MKRFIITITLTITITIGLYAQQVNEVQVRQRISQVASQMKSMQCDFVQTKHVKMLNDKLVSKGKMYYQQANKLRWEYITPYQYTFLLNDQKVQIKQMYPQTEPAEKNRQPLPKSGFFHTSGDPGLLLWKPGE